MPLVPLPSGAVAPLEEPGLIPLLSGGGGTLAVARATLAHAEVDAESLSDEDLFFVAAWGVLEFVKSADALDLQVVHQAGGKSPSERMAIADHVLSWTLDSGCFFALSAARWAASGSSEPDSEQPNDESEGGVRFSTPDTCDVGAPRG